MSFAKCRHRYFSKWSRYQRPAYTFTSCFGSRFTDNGDGTVTDNLSGLVWEKKTDDSGVHDKDNLYTWSTGTPYAENGTAFTSFLATLNGGGGFADANGWRLPTLAELQSIVLDFPCTKLSCGCPSSPCVDPALDAGTTQPFFYWSATSWVTNLHYTWDVFFADGSATDISKMLSYYVRAVRGGL